jgi:hypothetical protein
MHQFTHFQPWELEGLTPAQLRIHELVDRVMSRAEYKHLEYGQLMKRNESSLLALLGESKPPKIKERQVVRRMATRPDIPPCVKYKAVFWCDGRTVALGYFLNEITRDEAVTMAKTLRNMGIPLDAIREAVQRMTR